MAETTRNVRTAGSEQFLRDFCGKYSILYGSYEPFNPLRGSFLYSLKPTISEFLPLRERPKNELESTIEHNVPLIISISGGLNYVSSFDEREFEEDFISFERMYQTAIDETGYKINQDGIKYLNPDSRLIYKKGPTSLQFTIFEILECMYPEMFGRRYNCDIIFCDLSITGKESLTEHLVNTTRLNKPILSSLLKDNLSKYLSKHPERKVA